MGEEDGADSAPVKKPQPDVKASYGGEAPAKKLARQLDFSANVAAPVQQNQPRPMLQSQPRPPPPPQVIGLPVPPPQQASVP